MNEEYFGFERLNVYQMAIEFVNFLFNLYKRLPIESKNSIGNQLLRSAISIPNNIAEGSGKKSKKEKQRYYEYSLDSTKECIPPLTIANMQKQIAPEEYNKGRDYCKSICKMLVNLIKSVDN